MPASGAKRATRYVNKSTGVLGGATCFSQLPYKKVLKDKHKNKCSVCGKRSKKLMSMQVPLTSLWFYFCPACCFSTASERAAIAWKMNLTR